MADNEISLIIRAKNLASDSIKSVSNSVSDMAKNMNKKLIEAGLGFAALSAAILKSVGNAQKQEEYQRKLNVTLANQGKYTRAVSKDLIDYAAQLQNVTKFGDEEIINVEAIIARYGFEAEEVKKITKATLDLATAKEMDLASAAELVARTLGTSTNALAKNGLEIDGLAGSTERVNSFLNESKKLFDGQAEAAAKGLGALTQTKNLISDISENIGKQYLPAIKAANDATKSFFGLLEEHPLVYKLVAVVIGVTAAFAGLVASVGIFVRFLPVIKLGLLVVGTALGALASPLVGIAAALVAATVGFVAFRDNIRLYLNEIHIAFIRMELSVLKVIDDLNQKLRKQINKMPGIELKTGESITNADDLMQKLKELQAEYIKLYAVVHGGEATDAGPVNKPGGIKKDKIDDQQFAERKEQLDLWVSEQRAAGEYSLATHIEQMKKLLAFDDYTTKQRRELNIALNNLIVENDAETLEIQKMDLQSWVDISQKQGLYSVQEHMRRLKEMLANEKLTLKERNALQAKYNELAAANFDSWLQHMSQGASSQYKETAAIAKAMAIYDIGLKAAQAAMGAFNSLAAIPFVGPVLAVAAAAAALSFGNEQIMRVQAIQPQFADGGMVRGGSGVTATIGEPGRRGSHDEAVIPLDDPTTARRIQEAAGGGDQTIILKVGEIEIANAVIRGYNKGRNLNLVTEIRT